MQGSNFDTELECWTIGLTWGSDTVLSTVLTARQEGVIENSQHWLECSAYKVLRVGVDPENVLEDRVRYIRRVQLLREQLEKMVGR